VYRVRLLYGGELLCHGARESNTGKALVLTFGSCTCYKGICDCITEVAIPSRLVVEYVQTDGVKEGV
jgi:hypothetical protein